MQLIILIHRKKNIPVFDEMFEDYVRENVFAEFKNEHDHSIEKSKYNFNFNVWLQETKNLEYDDKTQYLTFLNKETFDEYLMYEIGEKGQQKFFYSLPSKAFKVFQENYNSLKEKFRVKRVATKQDSINFSSINLLEGDIIEYEPEYKTTNEAFQLLTQYYAKIYFELEKNLFIDRFKVWNMITIEAEILEIERFKNSAKELGLTDAVKAFGKWSNDKDEYVYNRLVAGFYENLEIEKYPLISSIGNIEARVYGRYILFYEFLKDQLNHIENAGQDKQNQMNFYEDIAHRLYVWDTTIAETKFEPFDFIEAKHCEAPYKGKVFYQNLMSSMPNHFGAKMRKDFFFKVLEYCKQQIDKIGQALPEPKLNKLKELLSSYGFFELPKVKPLSEQNKQILVELINSKPMPYGIAMYDYLGFCNLLDKEQGTKYKADKILSRFYNGKAKDGTAAKHYRRSLIKPLLRYKAGEYKQVVQTDYEKLK